jgi:processing peptidase subunit beta
MQSVLGFKGFSALKGTNGFKLPLVRYASQATNPVATAVPSHLLNTPPTKVSTLKNKMRVATEESFGETATVGVWIDAGSVYEDAKTNGVAHFLEHMAFKGTKNRSKEALEVEIENMGGSLNAYTSREQTVYYAKVFKNDVPKAMDILSDILSNSKFEERYLESERSTILREMEEVNKDTSEVIFDHLHAAAFQGTPLGRTILGPEENIKSITRDNLVQYIQANYHTPRMVVTAAGAIKHEEVVALAEKHFTSLPSSIEFAHRTPSEFTGSLVNVRDDTLEDAHVAVAVKGVSWSHPDYFVFMVMQTLVGSWDRTIGGGKNLSSRLCETISVMDLAHSLTSFNTCYSDTGLFGAYVTADPHKLDDLLFEVIREWVRLGRNVTEGEVEKAKSKLKASILMQLDGTTAAAEDIGRQLLTHGRRLTPAEIFMRINSITVKDVIRVAREYFEDVDPVVAAVGPTEYLPDYNTMRGWTYYGLV